MSAKPNEGLSWLESLEALKSTMAPDETPDRTADTAEALTDTTKTVGRLDIMLDRKGRNGKSATIIVGLDALSDDELKKLAAALKSSLATGGSARGGEILIQGDRRNDALKFLTDKGYKARII